MNIKENDRVTFNSVSGVQKHGTVVKERGNTWIGVLVDGAEYPIAVAASRIVKVMRNGREVIS